MGLKNQPKTVTRIAGTAPGHNGKDAWPTQPWPDSAAVVGEVKWLGRALV